MWPVFRVTFRTVCNFYSHIPCGMWRWPYSAPCTGLYFYSHIPCGMWPVNWCSSAVLWDFYSHIPCGMWLINTTIWRIIINFYSHIPCGMWLVAPHIRIFQKNFYSHIPCGMWLSPFFESSYLREFLLTHPVWDVTYWQTNSLEKIKISTHTSRVGCDLYSQLFETLYHNFYSHIPCGMWHNRQIHKQTILNFYSHIPCGMWPLYIVYYSLSIPIYHEMDL